MTCGWLGAALDLSFRVLGVRIPTSPRPVSKILDFFIMCVILIVNDKSSVLH